MQSGQQDTRGDLTGMGSNPMQFPPQSVGHIDSSGVQGSYIHAFQPHNLSSTAVPYGLMHQDHTKQQQHTFDKMLLNQNPVIPTQYPLGSTGNHSINMVMQQIMQQQHQQQNLHPGQAMSKSDTGVGDRHTPHADLTAHYRQDHMLDSGLLSHPVPDSVTAPKSSELKSQRKSRMRRDTFLRILMDPNDDNITWYPNPLPECKDAVVQVKDQDKFLQDILEGQIRERNDQRNALKDAGFQHVIWKDDEWISCRQGFRKFQIFQFFRITIPLGPDYLANREKVLAENPDIIKSTNNVILANFRKHTEMINKYVLEIQKKDLVTARTLKRKYIKLMKEFEKALSAEEDNESSS
eukprot:Clim_evm41s221 gene=Clim_evmTU41s221